MNRTLYMADIALILVACLFYQIYLHPKPLTDQASLIEFTTQYEDYYQIHTKKEGNCGEMFDITYYFNDRYDRKLRAVAVEDREILHFYEKRLDGMALIWKKQGVTVLLLKTPITSPKGG